jgi:undecaprenyl diphosphate synthase
VVKIHILYFPDGNKRFAEREGISFREAYNEGGRAFARIVDELLVKQGIDTLTFCVTSSYTHLRENETLPAMYEAAEETLKNLQGENFFTQGDIDVAVYGNLSHLPLSLQHVLKEIELSNHGKKRLNLLAGYSGTKDLQNAIAACAESGEEPTFDNLTKHYSVPPVDIIIRPGGEMRLSDGPILSVGQAAMFTLDKLHPEVKGEDLTKILQKYKENRDYMKTTNPQWAK